MGTVTRFRNPKDIPADMMKNQLNELKTDASPAAVSTEIVIQADNTEVIQFRGEDWRVFWPKHARNRTYDRHSNPKIARLNLKFLLHTLSPISNQFWDEFDGEVALRAIPLKSCFILKVDKNERKICVATFGDCATFNPRFGDIVITMTENGKIGVTRWANLYTTQKQEKKTLSFVAYKT